ncbi:MAG: sugar phosphate isomerase/epimerase [Lentisphaerae bacterium]|nr:sugar phosphate isomerase/epimerase [Lentisphaerota bacterium]
MRKGIYFSFLPGESVEEKFAVAAELGFDCVELPTLSEAGDFKRYRKAAKRAGLSIPSVMNSRHWELPLSDPDPEVRKASCKALLQSLKTAVELGADTVLLVPALVKPEVTYEEAWERSCLAIELLLPAFESEKVCLAIENVGNKFLLSPIEMCSYIDGFASPYLKAYFDVGNICRYGYPQHWIRSLGPRLQKVHIKGFDSQAQKFTDDLLGGDIHWPEVCKALQEVAYNDVLIAELRGKGDSPRQQIQNISADMDQIIRDNFGH